RASPKSGSFPRPELCCLGGRQYYYPVRLPLRCPGLQLWPYTRASYRGYRPPRGRSRVSPVAWTTFAACRPLYAGAVPGCSRIHGPDYCLRLTAPGSARSAPHGFVFRRGRVLFPYGLQLCSTSLRLRLSAVTGDFTTGLLSRLARTGLSPAGRPALAGRYCRSTKSRRGIMLLDGVLVNEATQAIAALDRSPLRGASRLRVARRALPRPLVR